jgi:hypothetical protein
LVFFPGKRISEEPMDYPRTTAGENGESSGSLAGDGVPGRVTPARQATGGMVLNRDAWGRLVLVDSDGRRRVGVEPVRAFPYSDPEHWISLVDSEGREVVCLETLAELPPETRQLIQEELSQREFVPVITRIVRVSSDSTPCAWDVETDRGPTRFTLNSEDDVRRLGPNRALVADVHGIRYLIPDTRTLDTPSRRLLERYL